MQSFGISVSLIQPGYVRSKMGAKAHSASASNYGVTQEQYELYRGVFEGFLAKDKLLSSDEHAMPPSDTTTAAYIDAIQSATPKTRYAVASVDGLPAWLIVSLKSLLPDRLFDLFV